MHRVIASTVIDAPPEAVWALLCVTEFVPTRRQVHERDDGTVRLHLEIDIEPTRTGCRLTHRFTLAPRGPVKLANIVLWPLFMRRMALRSTERTVHNLKAAAEAPVSS